jgi:hypothetical protein
MVKLANRGFRKFNETGNNMKKILNEWNYIDENNILVIVSNYKIIDGKKILFKTQRKLNLPMQDSKVLFNNGSPYYGCSYEYRNCEEYNYAIINSYLSPILNTNKQDNSLTLLNGIKIIIKPRK